MRESLFIDWNKEKIAVTIDYPENIQVNKKYPVVIICHGFIGSKVGVDRLFVKTAQGLTEDNNIVVRFDYVGCGESSGDYGKTGLHDLIAQTKKMIDFTYQLKQVEQDDITLLGHSLGGATAVLTASKDHRIKNMIIWSAVANPYKDIKQIVGREKVRTLKKNDTIQYLGYQFSKRFFDSLSDYEPLQSASQFPGDVLIIHGTGDNEIPVNYATEYERAFRNRHEGKNMKFEIIEANHTYSDVDHFSELISISRQWLQNNINLITT